MKIDQFMIKKSASWPFDRKVTLQFVFLIWWFLGSAPLIFDGTGPYQTTEEISNEALYNTSNLGENHNDNGIKSGINTFTVFFLLCFMISILVWNFPFIFIYILFYLYIIMSTDIWNSFFFNNLLDQALYEQSLWPLLSFNSVFLLIIPAGALGACFYHTYLEFKDDIKAIRPRLKL